MIRIRHSGNQPIEDTAYGNIIGYCDAAGNTVATYTYDAFGRTISSFGSLADVFAFRYSTKYFDRETGFYYYGKRYYSPALRRWLTRDPIGEQGGLNLYGFCDNNSLVNIDKLGEYTIQDAKVLLRNQYKDLFQGLAYHEIEFKAEEVFNKWIEIEQQDMSWINELPKCPKCISIESGRPRSPGAGWEVPHGFRYKGEVYHPGAKWEMRTTEASSLGAGNQCTYDSRGRLITHGYGIGTVDRRQASGAFGAIFEKILGYGHVANDVEPFDLALELDSGIHGRHVDQYLKVRPLWR